MAIGNCHETSRADAVAALCRRGAQPCAHFHSSSVASEGHRKFLRRQESRNFRIRIAAQPQGLLDSRLLGNDGTGAFTLVGSIRQHYLVSWDSRLLGSDGKGRIPMR